jgi:hypothetical protein
MKKLGDLHLAFDVGHSSIGWAVLRQSPAATEPAPEILGTGAVTFGADDCLAVKRRKNRQARRHARATRQRIAHIEKLLAHLGVLSTAELAARHDQGKGDSFSWRKAAEILAAARQGKPLPSIGWPDFWEILRWYAHNRGYFSPPWANRGGDSPASDEDEVSDVEKVANSHAIMREYGTVTMAETITAYTTWYDQEIAQWQQGKRSDKPRHFKGLNAAFERESVVWPEVRNLLTALKSRLPKLNDALIRTLLGNDPDPMKDREARRTIPCPVIKLPKRYHGGLLFGQSIPRFDNRIIGVCPIHFANRLADLLDAGFSPEDAKHEAAKQAKLPAKASPEFLRFRWAMQLANVFGATNGERETRPLSAEERLELTELAAQSGALTKAQFIKAVRSATGWTRDNLEAMLMHPDAEKALVLDPVQNSLRKSRLADALDQLPDQFRKRLRGRLTKCKTVTLGEVREWLKDVNAAAFDAAVNQVLDAAGTKRAKKQSELTRADVLAEKLTAAFPSGRAPYARPVLRQAYEEVMKGWDPRAEKSASQPRGCLCQTNELKEAQLQRRLEEQTNNHLIRHRLLILERLLADLIDAQEFANGDKSRIAGITIEVASDLRDLSGKTRKEQEQDLGMRLGDFKRVAAKVEEACQRRGIPVTAGWIRKARVAEDLGWRCPYTGKEFSIDTLLDGVMDKEHIIPHSDRQSDSLDSLVITWGEINKWKGKRTAVEFIRDEGGKPVPGRPELTIMTLAEFKKHVASLDVRKGHDDDRARKKRRIRQLLTETYEEKEFTPRDLTVTSHLVRLGAQVLLRFFPPDQRPPVVSLPGSVTGEVRKAWKLIGCLAQANPQILEADGQTPKRKQEIRGITHLHHALDACVLGLACLYFPRNGSVWGAMVKAGQDDAADADRRLWLAMTRRRPSDGEAALLRKTGLYSRDSEGRMRLNDLDPSLKNQISARLAEKRVVQHIPADMSGVKIEENTRGVRQIREDGRVELRQLAPRDAKTSVRPTSKVTHEAAGKLLGLKPTNGAGKLQRQKGVRVITDNFGVAILDHAPEGEEKFVVIPWHRVWHRLEELKPKNEGREPTVWRNGQLIEVPKEGKLLGRWRIKSVSNEERDGIIIKLSAPDSESIAAKPRLASLLKYGAKLLRTSLCG